MLIFLILCAFLLSISSNKNLSYFYYAVWRLFRQILFPSNFSAIRYAYHGGTSNLSDHLMHAHPLNYTPYKVSVLWILTYHTVVLIKTKTKINFSKGIIF